MAFPVPPDARAANTFEVVKGLDEALRFSQILKDAATVNVDMGEWLKPVVDGGVTKYGKLANGVDILATPAKGARASWTLYRNNDTSAGQADAVATGNVDVLSGTYAAKTKLYNTSGSFLAPGNLLVAIFDSGVGPDGGGYLDAPDPSSLSIAHLQGVVGRVIEHVNGVLFYESSS